MRRRSARCSQATPLAAHDPANQQSKCQIGRRLELKSITSHLLAVSFEALQVRSEAQWSAFGILQEIRCSLRFGLEANHEPRCAQLQATRVQTRPVGTDDTGCRSTVGGVDVEGVTLIRPTGEQRFE